MVGGPLPYHPRWGNTNWLTGAEGDLLNTERERPRIRSWDRHSASILVVYLVSALNVVQKIPFMNCILWLCMICHTWIIKRHFQDCRGTSHINLALIWPIGPIAWASGEGTKNVFMQKVRIWGWVKSCSRLTYGTYGRLPLQCLLNKKCLRFCGGLWLS